MSIIVNNGVQNILGTPGAISGVFADRPAAIDIAPGTLYFATDTAAIYQVVAGAWILYTGGGGGGSVNSVTGTAPIASSGGANPVISISQAGVATDGYLSSVDWNTFNNKIGGSGISTRVAFWDSVNTINSNAQLYWDNVNNRLGVGVSALAYKLDVNGNGRFTNDLYADTNLIVNNYFTINTTDVTFPFYVGMYRRKGNGFATYFQEDEQGGSKDKWAFVRRDGVNKTRDWSINNTSTVNVNLGFNRPNASNLSGASLLIDPVINVDANPFSPIINTLLRGVYYNPVLTSLVNTKHIGFENTTGDNYLNSLGASGGSTAIGLNSTTPIDSAFKLHVQGNQRLTGDLYMIDNRNIYVETSLSNAGLRILGNHNFALSNANQNILQILNAGSPINPVSGTNIYNLLSLNPVYEATILYNNALTTLRGIYYNPTFVNSTGLNKNIAFENVSGDIIFGNLASGSTPITFVDTNGKLGNSYLFNDTTNQKLYSQNSGDDKGIFLDFLNNVYKFGAYDYNNGTSLFISDNFNVAYFLNVVNGSAGAQGMYMDFANNRYVFGDVSNTTNGINIELNNADNQIFATFNNIQNGLFLNFNLLDYYLGDVNNFTSFVNVNVNDNKIFFVTPNGKYNFQNVPRYNDNADALANGLIIGDIYRTPDLLGTSNILKIVV